MTTEVEVIDGGTANYMGDGVWLVQQPSVDGPQSIALTREDLERMLEAR